jgi:hypothetical protein
MLAMKKLLLAGLCALVLAGCGDREAEQKAAAAAQAAKREQDAAKLAAEYEKARTAQNWNMARIHGTALLDQYPGTPAADGIKASFEEIRQRAQAEQEQRRLAALWNYAQAQAGKGVQRSAMINSKDGVDVDGSGKKPVQLIFRDHPEWKRSAYLVLQSGDFRCTGGCTLKVKIDGVAKTYPGYRPDTDEAIAMFIRNENALWKALRKAKTFEIEFPVKAGGTRTAVYEVGGLDGEQMPGWD